MNESAIHLFFINTLFCRVLASGTIISTIICTPAVKYILFLAEWLYYDMRKVIASPLFRYWDLWMTCKPIKSVIELHLLLSGIMLLPEDFKYVPWQHYLIRSHMSSHMEGIVLQITETSYCYVPYKIKP